VVSYLGRPFQTSEGRFQKMIQTDASINPGNSGGPLLDTDGDVVGINSAILGSENGGNIGIGFAVPINTARDLLPQLRKGKVVRGRIGVEVSPIGQDEVSALKLASTAGAIVRQVERDSPAERGGLRPGDVIVECEGQPVKGPDDLVARISNTAPGARVPIVVSRDGRRQTLTVTVEELESGGARSGANTSEKGYGLTLSDLTAGLADRYGLRAGTRGAVIDNIEPDGAAETAGLRVGDVVLEVNDQAVSDAAEAGAALDRASGPVVFLLISRDGNQMFVSLRRGQ